MEAWKEFELNCNEYLNEKYGNYFTHLGFSDSTVSDIKYENGEKIFYIEAKMPSAQSGQFVLLPDYENKTFLFSPRNKTELNENTDFIINYMNQKFDIYSNYGTSGEKIDISQDVFGDWIINYYKQKGVEFFITKEKNFIIFPIEKYKDYFFISANYRIKKSGSADVPLNRQQDVIKQLNLMNIQYELKNGFKLFSNQDLDGLKFSIGDSDYMIRKIKNNLYRIRKLSNTRNPNVIFSIKLIKEQDKEDLNNFLRSL